MKNIRGESDRIRLEAYTRDYYSQLNVKESNLLNKDAGNNSADETPPSKDDELIHIKINRSGDITKFRIKQVFFFLLNLVLFAID